MMGNSENLSGIIIKAVGGLYTVESPCGLTECKARGIFRKKGITPLVGDNVIVSAEQKVIEQVLPRKNSLIRPPLANLDQLVFVISMRSPSPNLTLLDKFIAVCEYKNIIPLIALTKVDLDSYEKIYDIYSDIGIKVIVIDYTRENPVEEIVRELYDKTSAFTGNTGVGKSTLLNEIDDTLNIATGEISRKLGRGRHTTRHAQLYKLKYGGYIADTPGFSSFDTDQMDVILKENLQYAFPDFAPFLGTCQFHDCSHRKEPGCAVRAAAEQGHIQPTRYDSYLRLYEKAAQYKEWEHK